MDKAVVRLLNGRGHRVVRAFDAGLTTASDADIVEYVLAKRLTLLTFDPDLRNSALHGECQVVHIRPRIRLLQTASVSTTRR